MRDFKSVAVGLFMAVTAIGLTSYPSHAILLDNGNSTTDTLTGLEWLDVSLTVNHSYNEIVGNFGGFADQGYVHATRSQFCGLLGALGDPIVDCFSVTHTDDPLDPGNSLELVNKLGVTNSSGDYYSTLGLFDDGSTGGNLASLGCIVAGSLGDCKEVGYKLPGSGQTTLNAGDITLNLGPTIGHFLVRRAATIPEPDTFALLLGGLTVFAGFRRRRRKG